MLKLASTAPVTARWPLRFCDIIKLIAVNVFNDNQAVRVRMFPVLLEFTHQILFHQCEYGQTWSCWWMQTMIELYGSWSIIYNPPVNNICNYPHKICNIRHTKSQSLNTSRLGLQLSLGNIFKPSGGWRCCWSSADRRCSNYIWVINNLIAY